MNINIYISICIKIISIIS